MAPPIHPVICVSLANADLRGACMAAFEGTPYEVVIGTEPAALKRAVVSICDADRELVEASLSEGVPLLLLSSAPGQSSLAEGIAQRGAGLLITPADFTEPRLRELALRLVNDPRFTAAAEAAGREIVTGPRKETC